MSLDGTSPNSMGAQLDMNNHKIINVTPATGTGEAVEYSQLASFVTDVTAITAIATAAAASASSSSLAASTSASNAAASASSATATLIAITNLYNQINNNYLGAAISDPAVDNLGNPLTVGDWYYNTVAGQLRIWDGTIWATPVHLTSSSADTFSNKTISLANNTITGTTAQFNTALTDNDFATLAGTETLTNKTLTAPLFATSLRPTANGTVPIGTTALGFTGVFLSTGATINIANSNWVATHTSGILTVSTGDLRVTTAGTNSASVVTVGGTQTLTAKTLTNAVVGTQALLNNSTTAASTAYVDRTTREKLTAGRNYYVRTDGSDSNNGLTNSAGGAFLTITKAISVVVGLDIGIYNVNINVGPGTYTAGPSVTTPWLGSGTVSVIGDIVTPSNCVISSPNGCVAQNAGSRISIGGFRFTSTGNALYALNGGSITYAGPMEFYGAGGSAIDMQSQGYGSTIVMQSSTYTVSGSKVRHVYALIGGYVQLVGANATMDSTPNWTQAFIDCQRGAFVNCGFGSITGSATGRRYLAILGAIINTTTGDPTFLAGSTDGNVTTGAIYT